MKLRELIKLLDTKAMFEVTEEHSTNILFESDRSSKILPEEYKKLKAIEDREVAMISHNIDDERIGIWIKIEAVVDAVN